MVLSSICITWCSYSRCAVRHLYVNSLRLLPAEHTGSTPPYTCGCVQRRNQPTWRTVDMTDTPVRVRVTHCMLFQLLCNAGNYAKFRLRRVLHELIRADFVRMCLYTNFLSFEGRDADCGVLVFCRTPTPTLGLTVWHNDCVLKDDLIEISNSSNQKCTIV